MQLMYVKIMNDMVELRLVIRGCDVTMLAACKSDRIFKQTFGCHCFYASATAAAVAEGVMFLDCPSLHPFVCPTLLNAIFQDCL